MSALELLLGETFNGPGVSPLDWVSALVADYNTLREKATEAGVENIDPDSEAEMLSQVRVFLRQCELYVMRNQVTERDSQYPPPDIITHTETDLTVVPVDDGQGLSVFLKRFQENFDVRI